MQKKFLFLLVFFLLILAPAMTLAVSGDVDVVGNVIGTDVVPEPTPSGSSSYTMSFSITSILVQEVSTNSAVVSWKTNEDAICKLFWGKSADYELGSILEEGRSINHFTNIPDLLASTTYHFKVSCQNRIGQGIETPDQKFITLALEKKAPPSEVGFFESIASDAQVELRWENPDPSLFKGVRLVRSINNYPQTPLDEDLVYDGQDSSFLDKGLTNGTAYYYSIFTYDKYGNYSSGSFVFGIPKAKEEKPEEVTGKIEVPQEPTPQIPPEIIQGKLLELTDFVFSQEGKILFFKGDTVSVEIKKPFSVSVIGEKISSEAKNITLTVFQPNPLSRTFQYDPVKKEFVVVDPSIDQVGEYFFVIQVINENGEVFGFTMGKIKAEAPTPKIIEAQENWCKQAWNFLGNIYQKIIEFIGSLINKAVIYSSFFPQLLIFFIAFLIIIIFRGKKG